jgi:hypothetical protein
MAGRGSGGRGLFPRADAPDAYESFFDVDPEEEQKEDGAASPFYHYDDLPAPLGDAAASPGPLRRSNAVVYPSRPAMNQDSYARDMAAMRRAEAGRVKCNTCEGLHRDVTRFNPKSKTSMREHNKQCILWWPEGTAEEKPPRKLEPRLSPPAYSDGSHAMNLDEAQPAAAASSAAAAAAAAAVVEEAEDPPPPYEEDLAANLAFYSLHMPSAMDLSDMPAVYPPGRRASRLINSMPMPPMRGEGRPHRSRTRRSSRSGEERSSRRRRASRSGRAVAEGEAASGAASAAGPASGSG